MQYDCVERCVRRTYYTSVRPTMAGVLAETINQDFLHCGICLEPFRKPCALPCLHSFCEECLERWTRANTKDNIKPSAIVCPNCQKAAAIPTEGIQGFPAHFLVNSLQETLSMEKVKQEDKPKRLCTTCKKPDLNATFYCQACKHYLCQSCYDIHKVWEATKRHRVVTIKDLDSGKVTLLNIQEQYCSDHEGEVKKFYCKTCDMLVCRDCIVMKQHCRDHDYVTLKDAATEKLNTVKKEIKKYEDKQKECQDKIQETETMKSKLISAATDARNILQNVKEDYFRQIEEFFARKEDDIQQHEEQGIEDLDNALENLQDKMNQLEDADKPGKTLIESHSHYDIVSNYDSVMDTLQEVNLIELDEVDTNVSEIPSPALTCILNQRWKQVGQFKVDTQYGPTGIAVTSDGKIAVCDCYFKMIVHSKSGDLLHTINDGKLGGDGDVCVTSTNGYVVPKYNNCCSLYNIDYKLMSKFQTYDANKTPSEARAVAVDKNGCIVLGMYGNAISIHNADGLLKSSFALPYQPRSVAFTFHEEIVVAGNNNTLQLFDYSGKCIQILDPPPEVRHWKPWYVCCSTTDEVFVANNGDPMAIYKYAAGRVYMGCVTTEVSNPWGIALSHDDQELYVADYSANVVNIFQRPHTL